MIASKARVAPLKTLTIPRLELISARLLAQFVDAIKTALRNQVNIIRTTYWLDSKTALCWIRNPGEWKQFVRHRVDGILKLSLKNNWRHCPGVDNPADIGSRGLGATQLKQNMLWWQGPSWLVNESTSWPVETPCTQTSDSQAEEKKTAQASMIVQTRQDSGSIAAIICLSSYSNLLSLFRITAWVLRFARKLQHKN